MKQTCATCHYGGEEYRADCPGLPPEPCENWVPDDAAADPAAGLVLALVKMIAQYNRSCLFEEPSCRECSQSKTCMAGVGLRALEAYREDTK